MASFRSLSVKKKLLLISMLASAAALMLASIALILFGFALRE